MRKLLFISTVLLSLAFTNIHAQWTDGGTWIRTDDNVGIGSQTNAHSLYVRSDKTGWQGGFVNRGGPGANVYLSHGDGYGMHIKTFTADSKYTLQMHNLNGRTNIFYNNGKVGLGLVGNVGIGTTNPDEKLHLTGAIRGHVSGALRISTGHGYVDVGPKNTGWTHFTTDRPRFYFNKEIRVATGMLGSYNTNLILRTQGTTRMTILKSNGNVGIGTTAPTSKLQVHGGTIVNSHTTPAIDFKETDTNVTWRTVVGGDQFILQRTGADKFVVNNQGHVIIKEGLFNNGSPDFRIAANHANGRLLLQTAGQNRLAVANNGNIGIGTSSPNYKLDVSSTGTTIARFMQQNTSNTNARISIRGSRSSCTNCNISYIDFENHDSNEGAGTNYTMARVSAGMASNSGMNGYLRFFTTKSGTPTEQMRITSDGEVKIGTVPNLPGNYKLYVDDGILSEKVRVAVQNTSDWADYVFEDEYELMSLEKVNNYIKTNQHLPGVPSAEEVVEQGIDVAQMDAILLKKLEEAYLHIIDMKDEIEQLKAQMKSKN